MVFADLLGAVLGSLTGEVSPAVRDLVAEAGYATAVTTEPGVFRPGTDRLLISRFRARAHSLNFRNVFRLLTGQLGTSSVPARQATSTGLHNRPGVTTLPSLETRRRRSHAKVQMRKMRL